MSSLSWIATATDEVLGNLNPSPGSFSVNGNVNLAVVYKNMECY
jgi:hypothetical protein